MYIISLRGLNWTGQDCETGQEYSLPLTPTSPLQT